MKLLLEQQTFVFNLQYTNSTVRFLFLMFLFIFFLLVCRQVEESLLICLPCRILDIDSLFNEALLQIFFSYHFCQLYFYKWHSKINHDPSAKVSGSRKKKTKQNKNNKINRELLQLSQRKKKASNLTSPFLSVCTNIRHMAERSGLF